MSAIAREATAADAGRACPFCRFALKAGAQAAQCPACSAVHHAECWADNGGCAIMGCAAAPGQRAAAPAPPPPPPPRVAPAPTAGDAAAPPPRSASPGSRALLVAVIVATLVVAGAAVALVLTRTGGSHAAANVVTTVITAAAAPQVTGTTTVAAPPSPAGGGADETRTGTDQAAIERVLTAYYQHVVAGDFNAAWALLSPTYTAWKAGNGGHAKWLEQERVDRDRLDPGGLHVEVDRIDGDVATITVTGMRFRSLTSSRCAYEGVTWARRDGSRWRYDQGYLQNATRAATWRPRRTETLGYTCESSGY